MPWAFPRTMPPPLALALERRLLRLAAGLDACRLQLADGDDGDAGRRAGGEHDALALAMERIRVGRATNEGTTPGQVKAVRLHANEADGVDQVAVTLPGALVLCDVKHAVGPDEFIGVRKHVPPDDATPAPTPSGFLKNLVALASSAAHGYHASAHANSAMANKRVLDRALGSLTDQPPAEKWEVLWKHRDGADDGNRTARGPIQRFAFGATPEVTNALQAELDGWRQHTASPPNSAAVVEGENDGGGGGGGDSASPLHPTHIALTATSEATPELAPAASHEPGSSMYPTPPPAKAALLDASAVSLLASALPPTRRHATWRLLYATHAHGFSLASLYRAAANAAPAAIVVQDAGGALFGAYVTEPLRVASRYYGTGETFVFRLGEHGGAAYGWAGRVPRAAPANELFVYGAADALTVGGGGRPALWLDGDLNLGASGACDTFASPSLSSTPDFQVRTVEVYAVG